MKIIKIILYIILVLLFTFVIQSEVIPQKVVEAVRVNGPVKIDGILKEKIWQTKGYSDFVQSDPKDGGSPTEKTVVWIAYDEKALYVAARLYDSQPEKIISRLGRRDDFVDSDWFIFSIDPYYDQRTGYQFAVNPAGSIVDWTLYNDEWNDTTWDGVWENATCVDKKGWSVEMRIPYHQLRFKKKKDYIWGVNFSRTIKRKNERVGFVWIPKEESGYVSRFAKLVGINGINPGRNMEMLPFTVAKAAFSPAEEGNPFLTGKEYFANAGVDLKVGLKSNLTLDATVNPDFGQVEVDPAVINLSAYETYYSERRPFFIEGSNIFRFGYGGATSFWGFDWGGPSFFYSRRIGRFPQKEIDSDGYVKYPDWTTILTAAKITGKIQNGWNIGFLNALTERECAQIDLDGERFSEEVEPFSYYGVLRAQREFNQGRQGFGLIATSVLRDLKTDGLEELLAQKAFSLAVDGWTFLDKNKTWVVTGWLGGTRVSGSESAIMELQLSSLHYFQRPDATHVNLDEQATSMSGWASRLTINKQKGHLLFNAAVGAISPGFDSSNLGFQWMGDVINSHIGIGYQTFHPGKVFRRWHTIIATHRNYDFGGNRLGEGYYLFFNGQFLNYWGVDMLVGYYPDHWSNNLTRGGPLTLSPSFGFTRFGIFSDNRKAVVLSLNGNYFNGRAGFNSWSLGLNLKWKPRSNISISLGPGYSFRRSISQWVTDIDDALMTETYGTRYIFADMDQRTLSSVVRLNWTFTPKLSLQVYLQPFIAVGAYDRFKELARPRSYDFNYFDEEESKISYDEGVYTVDPDGPGPVASFSFDNPDFNFKSLRGTVVLRWEFKPGSTLYLVWTQNRIDEANPGNFRFGRDIRDLFRATGDNIFLIKFSYRFKI